MKTLLIIRKMQTQNLNEIYVPAARILAQALLMEQPALGKKEETLRLLVRMERVQPLEATAHLLPRKLSMDFST